MKKRNITMFFLLNYSLFLIKSFTLYTEIYIYAFL